MADQRNLEAARQMAMQRMAEMQGGMPADPNAALPMDQMNTLGTMAETDAITGLEPGKNPIMPELEGDMTTTGTPVTDDHAAGGLYGTETKNVDEARISKAIDTLRKYKAGKASIEQRIISAEQWWKGRNWDEVEKDGRAEDLTGRRSGTNWLWNSIVGKHADAMAAYPEPIILPRAQDDKDEAKRLSSVVPVVLGMCDFEETYSSEMWRKMREGTGAYAVMWDKTAGQGMGDVVIRGINLLNLFWEPGVSDIQDSRNLFYVSMIDNEVLDEMYPELQGQNKGGSLITVSKYQYDDNVDTSEQSLMVDWYYKKWVDGQQVLHYCKFVGSHVLYATEDDPELAGSGLYDDGQYPFVLDPLYPVEGSPCGYGYIDICKDAQTDIDLMNEAIVQNAINSANPRYFGRKDGGINEDEFLNVTKPIVHVNGNLGEDTLQPIMTPVMPGSALAMLQNKVEELKFVTGNNDVNNGGTGSGVTAASAIAALQEASGRTSKDSTKAAYRAYKKIVTMVIERIRQFYDMQRQFRITGEMGQQEFIGYDNRNIQPQYQGMDFDVDMGYRLPVFDIDVKAQSETAYTKVAQNELAIQLLQLGVFNPQNATISMELLEMMDFKGKDELMQRIQRNGTMQQMLLQFQQIALSLAQKYDPAIAEQLGQMIMQGQQQLGGAPVQGGPVDPKAAQQAADQAGGDAHGANIVKKAADRSAASVMPN